MPGQDPRIEPFKAIAEAVGGPDTFEQLWDELKANDCEGGEWQAAVVMLYQVAQELGVDPSRLFQAITPQIVYYKCNTKHGVEDKRCPTILLLVDNLALSRLVKDGHIPAGVVKKLAVAFKAAMPVIDAGYNVIVCDSGDIETPSDIEKVVDLALAGHYGDAAKIAYSHGASLENTFVTHAKTLWDTFMGLAKAATKGKAKASEAAEKLVKLAKEGGGKNVTEYVAKLAKEYYTLVGMLNNTVHAPHNAILDPLGSAYEVGGPKGIPGLFYDRVCDGMEFTGICRACLESTGLLTCTVLGVEPVDNGERPRHAITPDGYYAAVHYHITPTTLYAFVAALRDAIRGKLTPERLQLYQTLAGTIPAISLHACDELWRFVHNDSTDNLKKLVDKAVSLVKKALEKEKELIGKVKKGEESIKWLFED